MDQMQRHADRGHGGDAPASAHAQQAGPDKSRQQEQQPPSSLNPTAARLLREAIVSQPDGEKPLAATGSSDILAFARSVDRVDSPLEQPLSLCSQLTSSLFLFSFSFSPSCMYSRRNKKGSTLSSLFGCFNLRQFDGHFCSEGLPACHSFSRCWYLKKENST